MIVRHVGLMLVLGTLAVAGCSQTPRYEVLSSDLLEVHAPSEAVSGAIWNASLALAQCTSTRPDGPYCPSLVQIGSWWGLQEDPEVFRNIVTFTDTSGRAVRIEAISRHRSSLLVFVECEAPGDPLTVLNQITKSLDKAGARGSARPIAAEIAAP